MKKHLLVIASICTFACCLSGCANKKYDNLNSMLDLGYSKVKLTIINTFDEDTSLKSEYTINYSDSEITVSYKVEQFEELSLNSPLTDSKKTLTGEATIKDGVITTSGDKVEISANIATISLTFRKSYFSNVVFTTNSLTADVVKASDFLGSDIVCSDMKVKAVYVESFHNIGIEYTAESGTRVELTYNFTL